MMDTRVWELATDSNKDMVIRTDLRYFRTHFIGKPMADTWEVPELEIYGKSKRVRDFVSWQRCAPVLSERALDVLRPLVEPHVEILPLCTLKKKRYFALNVLTLVDCLDRDRSDFRCEKHDPEIIWSLRKASFDPARVQDVPIFKLPQYTGTTFVRRPFIDAVLAGGLKGAYFVDPYDPMRYVFQKHPDMIDDLTGPEYRTGEAAGKGGPGAGHGGGDGGGSGGVPQRRERPLTREEDGELQFFARQGLARLGLKGSEPPGVIVKAVAGHLDDWRKKHRKPSEDDVLVFALENSVLWATQVVRTLGWQWTAVLEEDGEPLYAVASPDRSRVVYPVVWFGDLARNPGLENNLILVFNMLREGKLPPAPPRSYREVR